MYRTFVRTTSQYYKTCYNVAARKAGSCYQSWKMNPIEGLRILSVCKQMQTGGVCMISGSRMD